MLSDWMECDLQAKLTVGDHELPELIDSLRAVQRSAIRVDRDREAGDTIPYAAADAEIVEYLYVEKRDVARRERVSLMVAIGPSRHGRSVVYLHWTAD